MWEHEKHKSPEHLGNIDRTKCPPEEPPVRIPKIPPSGRLPKRPEPCKPTHTDCCDQVLEILSRGGTVDPRLLHKPKTSTRRKLDCLCGRLPGKDAVGPILFHILERHVAKKNPGNDFEAGLFKVLDTVPAKGMEALKSNLAAYRGLPKHQLHCLFATKFVEWPLDEAIPVETVTQEWLSEGMRFAGDVFFPKSGGGTGAAQARRWSQTVFGSFGDAEVDEAMLTAPWPWICKVFTGTGEDLGFRNNDHKPKVTNFQPHEIDQTCEPELSDGYLPEEISQNCTPTKPTQGPDDLFGSCFGGPTYTTDVCLKVPEVIPGQAVTLSGFNFLSDKCRIQLIKKDQSITYPDIDVLVWPDLVTPLTDENGEIIADCTVDDRIEFNLPDKHPDKVATFQPGLYEVRVIVPNDGQHVVTNDIGEPPTVPNEFISNVVLLNVLPDPNLKYRITNNWGKCYEETDGPGGDEIWFHTAVTSVNPDTLKIDLDFKMLPKVPWDDMDSGEVTGEYGPFEFFSGPAPAVAIALIGFEVDSEDAAKEQIQAWSDAFGMYISAAWELIVGSGAASTALAVIEVISAVVAFIIAVVAIVVIVIIGLFWAAWAPADLIASDVWVWTAGKLFDFTDAKTPLPGTDKNEVQGIKVHVEPIAKVAASVDADFAKYTEERRYRCEEEDSRYGLRIHVDRLP